MTPRFTPLQMMRAHIALNLGTFFDDMQILEGLCFATSAAIPDFYWNYAYSLDGESLSPRSLNTVIREFRRLDRQPTIWQPSTYPLPAGWEAKSEEVWMWLDPAERPLRGQRSERGVADFLVTEYRCPSDKMVEVFADAYSSDAKEGDIGYFRLPPEYGQAYARSTPRAPAQVCHFGGSIGGACVAVATAGVWEAIGGIYSVGTLHGQRQKGFGREISRRAAEWAIANGALGVMLQTSADSPVETMYSQLGFVKTHAGVLASPATSS